MFAKACFSLVFSLILTNVFAGAMKADSSTSGVILQYHHISSSTPAATSVSPAVFRAQLKILAEEKFQVWPLPKFIEALKSQQTIPDKVVVITFDDGYEDNYTQAAPILKEFGFPFTVFVSTDYVDRKQNGYMSWDQVRALKKQGATIANHTRSHPHLLRLLPDESEQDRQQRIKNSIEHAESRIAAETGDNYRYFAYPYGETSPEISRWLQEWGYVGFGQQSGAADLYSLNAGKIPRFPFNKNYSELTDFRIKASSVAFAVTKASYDKTIWEAAVSPKLRLEVGVKLNDQLQCYFGSESIPITKLSDSSFEVQAAQPIPVGRSRYNCTMPVPGMSGRYYWYSKQWIRKQDNGSWYPEP